MRETQPWTGMAALSKRFARKTGKMLRSVSACSVIIMRMSANPSTRAKRKKKVRSTARLNGRSLSQWIRFSPSWKKTDIRKSKPVMVRALWQIWCSKAQKLQIRTIRFLSITMMSTQGFRIRRLELMRRCSQLFAKGWPTPFPGSACFSRVRLAKQQSRLQRQI